MTETFRKALATALPLMGRAGAALAALTPDPER